jgi:hypothetical protein
LLLVVLVVLEMPGGAQKWRETANEANLISK